MTTSLRSTILLIGLVALLAAACSSTGGGAASPSAAPSVAAPSVPAPSEPAGSPAGGDAVALDVADGSLGQIVVDGEGLTLYGFTPDEAGTSTCYDACAANWPPLLADDPAAVTVAAGLDKAKLTTADRTDGGKQLLYNGWPLYYFANDAAAGDVNGQGLNDKWYVVSPAGDLIKD
jgi:predicted lipoprotein with Yx(FWY)xxD motif